jgi:hypothetical protein
MKVYFTNFWSGFDTKVNPINSNFFIDLLTRVFDTNIETGSFDESEILFESIFGETFVGKKDWKYTFLFSGESRCPTDVSYTAILKQSRSYDNIIHCPLFVPYLYFKNKQQNEYYHTKYNTTVPKKFACTFISNSNGKERNTLIEALEKYKSIDHFGGYKNNQDGVFPGDYGSKQILEKMKEYKFIIGCENSQEDAYITEKIVNPFFAGVIPIYWGCDRICDYFNEKRFIHMKDDSNESINGIIDIITELDNDDEKYINIINSPINTITNVIINIDTIAENIKELISAHPFYTIKKVFVITDKNSESDRYTNLVKQFNTIQIPPYLINYTLPTYYNNLDSNLISQFIIDNTKLMECRNCPLSDKELSLFLNFYIIFKRIAGYYKDGNFITFESDIYFVNKVDLFYSIFSMLQCNNNNFDCISFGEGWCGSSGKYNDNSETLELVSESFTRCTDSFVWSYKGICTFIEYLEKNRVIDWPIDFYLNEFFKNNTSYNFLWTVPYLTIQGSQRGFCKSLIQN